MSLDYELRIDSTWDSVEVLGFLKESLNFQHEESENSLWSPGIWLRSSRETEKNQTMMQSWFGFKPTLRVGFVLNSLNDYEIGKTTLLKTVVRLLQEIPGDAVLLFNYESLVLQRIAGELIFNQTLQTWPNSEISAVTSQFHLAPLRSPLLTDDSPQVEIDQRTYPLLTSVAIRQGKSIKELATEAIDAYLKQAVGEK
jgi:hypothetical protein